MRRRFAPVLLLLACNPPPEAATSDGGDSTGDDSAGDDSAGDDPTGDVAGDGGDDGGPPPDMGPDIPLELVPAVEVGWDGPEAFAYPRDVLDLSDGGFLVAWSYSEQFPPVEDYGTRVVRYSPEGVTEAELDVRHSCIDSLGEAPSGEIWMSGAGEYPYHDTYPWPQEEGWIVAVRANASLQDFDEHRNTTPVGTFRMARPGNPQRANVALDGEIAFLRFLTEPEANWPGYSYTISRADGSWDERWIAPNIASDLEDAAILTESGPIVVSGTRETGGRGTEQQSAALAALDEASGETLWTETHDHHWRLRASAWAGEVAVADQASVAPYLNTVRAVDAEDGVELWRVTMPEGLDVYALAPLAGSWLALTNDAGHVGWWLVDERGAEAIEDPRPDKTIGNLWGRDEGVWVGGVEMGSLTGYVARLEPG